MRYASDEPVPLSDALAAVGAELGLPAGNAHADLEAHWADVMGVDGPIWATQMRYLETAVIERAEAVFGPGVVTALKVRVGTPPAPG